MLTCLTSHFVLILHLPQGYWNYADRIAHLECRAFCNVEILMESQCHLNVFVLFCHERRSYDGNKVIHFIQILPILSWVSMLSLILLFFFLLPLRMIMACVTLQAKATNRLLPTWSWIPASDTYMFCITVLVEAYLPTSYEPVLQFYDGGGLLSARIQVEIASLSYEEGCAPRWHALNGYTFTSMLLCG